jgi:hypothetical protein
MPLPASMNSIHDTAYPLLSAQISDDALRAVYTPTAAELRFVLAQFRQAPTRCGHFDAAETASTARVYAAGVSHTRFYRRAHLCDARSIGSDRTCRTCSGGFRRSMQAWNFLLNQQLNAILAKILRIPADPRKRTLSAS